MFIKKQAQKNFKNFYSTLTIKSQTKKYFKKSDYMQTKGFQREYFEEHILRKISDDREISKKIIGLKKTWITTYDNYNDIRNLYDDFRIAEFDINYSLQEKKKETEIIIYSDNLAI